MDCHKHVVFFCLDAPGHINPLVAIADELHTRLHRTTFVTQYPLRYAERLRERGHHVHHCIDPPASAVPVRDTTPESSTSSSSTTVFNRKSDSELEAEVEADNKASDDKTSAIVSALADKFRDGPLKAFTSTYSRDGPVWKYLEDVKRNHSAIEAKLRNLHADFIIVDHVIGVPCATWVAPRWCRFFSPFPLILYSSCNRRMAAGVGYSLDQMPEFKEQEIAIKAPLRQAIRELFLSYNLDDWPSLVDLCPSSPYLNFYMGNQELGFESLAHINQLPSYWTRCEQLVLQEHGQWNVPDKLLDGPGKLIYMSLGTLVSGDVHLMQRLLSFLSELPHRFIVSLGASDGRVELADNQWGARYLPQTLVLPQVDLCITHGGHNTLIECFYFGVPGLVVMPVFADQFDGAQRVHELGFGIRLNPFECTQEELHAAIEKLLNDETLRHRMGSIGERLRSTDCARIAVDKIESSMAFCDINNIER